MREPSVDGEAAYLSQPHGAEHSQRDEATRHHDLLDLEVGCPLADNHVAPNKLRDADEEPTIQPLVSARTSGVHDSVDQCLARRICSATGRACCFRQLHEASGDSSRGIVGALVESWLLLCAEEPTDACTAHLAVLQTWIHVFSTPPHRTHSSPNSSGEWPRAQHKATRQPEDVPITRSAPEVKCAEP